MPETLKRTFLAAALLWAVTPTGAFALKTERLSAGFLPSVTSASSPALSAPMEVVSGVVSVRFAAGVSTQAASAALAAAGASLADRPPVGDWRLVELPAGMSVGQGLAALRLLPAVAAVEPDKVYKVSRVPDDPAVGLQYALAQVQAFGAWEYGIGDSTRVTVAVIDTGVDSSHPDLAGKFSDSVSQFCDPGNSKSVGADNVACAADNPPTAACYHGTAVAGVAAAATDNGVGMAGVGWNARLVSMKVFKAGDCTAANCGGSGCGTDDWAMADALNFLATKHNTAAYGKIVANLSLGCRYAECGNCSVTLQTAVNAAVNAGMLVFAAAGNGADPDIDTPANCSGVIPVGATDSQDRLASFSSYESTMAAKGLTAPGVEVYTTTLNSAYTTASGTSFASPMAAGAAALVWAAKPSAAGGEVRDFLMTSADDLGDAGPDKYYGRGRINALKAMRLAVGETRAFKGQSKAVAYPNPFRPKTHRLVTFSVPAQIAGGETEVHVFTSEGEQVRKLDGLSWDGRNESGEPVATGVYFFRVKTGKDTAVGRLALVR